MSAPPPSSSPMAAPLVRSSGLFQGSPESPWPTSQPSLPVFLPTLLPVHPGITSQFNLGTMGLESLSLGCL